MSKKKVTAYDNSTTIQIDPRNEIGNPDKVRGEPDGQVLFNVENLDDVAHTVSIPTDKVKNKGSGKLENPFKKKTLEPATVQAGRRGFITAELKSKFKNPDEQFKYTIESDGKSLDPDLDVVDPNPTIPGTRRSRGSR
jgi:hypothetical protein